MKKTINHATSQPNINFSGSIDGGFSSCVVEANSKLLLNHLSRMTNPTLSAAVGAAVTGADKTCCGAPPALT